MNALTKLASAAGLHLQEAAAKVLTRDDVARMTAGQINKALGRLEKESSKVTAELLAAGRDERPSERRTMTDPLSVRDTQVSAQLRLLRDEVAARYGSGSAHRLPTGRGFGPRK